MQKYKKTSDYSYALGTELTYQLLLSHPEQVTEVFIHSKQNDNDIYRKIVECAQKNGITITRNDKVFNILSDKENCYIIGAFKKYDAPISKETNHVLLVNPSNTGNLGTIIRTSVGFGIFDIALITPCVDIFDPKVIRASMGAFFEIRFSFYSSFEEYEKSIDKRDVFPFMLDGAKQLDKIEIPDNFTLVFGNEATGLPSCYQNYGQSVLIKHLNTIDSLNLCNAVSIGLYEFTKRQMNKK